MKLMQVGAKTTKQKKKRELAVTKRNLAVARVELCHHHHVERCKAKSRPSSKGKKPRRALYGKTRQEEMQKTATNGNVYLGRDPEGPLAPEEGQRTYSTVCPPS